MNSRKSIRSFKPKGMDALHLSTSISLTRVLIVSFSISGAALRGTSVFKIPSKVRTPILTDLGSFETQPRVIIASLFQVDDRPWGVRFDLDLFMRNCEARNFDILDMELLFFQWACDFQSIIRVMFSKSCSVSCSLLTLNSPSTWAARACRLNPRLEQL